MIKMKTLFTALLLCSDMAFAASPLDGIYSCQTSTQSAVAHIYIAINSNANLTVVTVPSVQGINLMGYVLGPVASETSFSGTSDSGYQYSATASGAVGAKIISFRGTLNSVQYGPVAFTGTCSQII